MGSLEQIQLEYGFLIQPLIVGTLVAIVCSVIGCFIILRGMSFLADAIAHSMFTGVIAGYLIIKITSGRDAPVGAMFVGAIFAGVITVAMVGLVTRFSRIKQDAAIGIMYTGIFALGAFVISIRSVGNLIHVDIYHYIVGSVIGVTDQELWLLAIVTSIVLCVVLLFYRPLQLTSFDPIMAASIGIPVLAVEYLLTACTSLVVVSGVQIVGVIMVVALMITPAATAYLLSDRLDRMILISIVFGITGFWLGFWLAALVGAAPGAAVVVTMTAQFLVTLVLAPRYGLLADWIRRSNSVPQEIMEDVLGAVLRAKTDSVAIAAVEQNVTTQNIRIHRAINMLARQDLLEIDNQRIRLTDAGRLEANRLVRAHRLWETYLQQTGTPETELHQKAHVLEHISDRATVEYLDDRLGHPLTDPHGSEIPSDPHLTETDQEFIASLLRSGNRAIVRRVQPAAESLGLKPGDQITMSSRSADGKTWTLVTGNQQELNLSHEQADALIVQRIQ